jgi:hypothetical protein
MPATAGLLAYLVAQPPTIRWSITMKRELMGERVAGGNLSLDALHV